MVISKFFTAAKTILNARAMLKKTLYKLREDILRKCMISVIIDLEGLEEFDFDPGNSIGSGAVLEEAIPCVLL